MLFLSLGEVADGVSGIGDRISSSERFPASSHLS